MENPASDNRTPHSLDLETLLTSTATGNAIKSIYKKQQHLDSRSQLDLCDIIAEYFLNTSSTRRLKNHDYEILSQKIVKIFPNESPLVYYSPPISKKSSKENKSIPARGRLVDKYRNKLSFLRKAGVIAGNQEVEDEEGSSDQTISHTSEDINWLKHNWAPWNEVEEKWAKTYTIRMSFFHKENTVSSILAEYPVLTHDLGYQLIDYDFRQKYPLNFNNIYQNFSNVFFKLYELKKKILNYDDKLIMQHVLEENVNADVRYWLMMNLLSSMLPSKPYKRSRNNSHPELQDCKKGVVLQIKNPAELHAAVEEKRHLSKKYNFPMFPFIVVWATSSTDIKSIWVSFDQILYKPTNFLKAVDICFQLIHVLNLMYPYQTEHIWLFIERAVYKLKSSERTNIPNIIDICNKIEIGLGKN